MSVSKSRRNEEGTHARKEEEAMKEGRNKRREEYRKKWRKEDTQEGR